MSPLILLGSSVMLNAVAQISLRYSSAGPRSGERGFRTFWLGMWVVCFGIATVLWLAAIRTTDISYAFPMLGAGYVIVTLLAKWFLGEKISALRWISILVISAGVVIVGTNR